MEISVTVSGLKPDEFSVLSGHINSMTTEAVGDVAQPAAQPAPATVTVTGTGTVDGTHDVTTVDADGLPWDARIHSDSKGKTEAGKWKKRKGVGKDKALIAQVEAELRGTAPVGQPAAQPAPAPVGQPAAQPAPAPVGQPAAQPAPAPVGQPAAQPAPAAPVSTVASLIQTAQVSGCRMDIPYDAMMQQVNVALADAANLVGPTDLPTICTSFGLTTLPDCANDPETIGKIYYVLGGQ